MVETLSTETNTNTENDQNIENNQAQAEDSKRSIENYPNLPQEPLTGKELLNAISTIQADKSEKAIRTGYYTVTDKGTVRALNTQFLEALCDAKAIPFKDEGKYRRRGRNATYYTKVQAIGSITVGRRYVEEWGLNPGDPVKIQVKRKQLILRKLEESEMEDFNKQQDQQEEELLEDQQDQVSFNQDENIQVSEETGLSQNSDDDEDIKTLVKEDSEEDTEQYGLNEELDW